MLASSKRAAFQRLRPPALALRFLWDYPDGEKIPKEEMFAAVARIASAVDVPVTADVEAGYGNRPEDAAETARAVIDAGAVGMNLEDATGDSSHPLVELTLQLEKIRAVRQEAARRGRADCAQCADRRLPAAGWRSGKTLRRSPAPVECFPRCWCRLCICSRLAGCRDDWPLGRRSALSAEYSGRPRFGHRFRNCESWAWRESAWVRVRCEHRSACCGALPKR